MFDHIGLRVKDLAAAVKLYRAMLEPLGLVLCSEDASGAGFGPNGEPVLWLVPGAGQPSGGHIAFKAKARKAVDAFHRAALAAGARDHGAPGVRADYSPTYYAAFVVDADGHNLEAVTFEQ